MTGVPTRRRFGSVGLRGATAPRRPDCERRVTYGFEAEFKVRKDLCPDDPALKIIHGYDKPIRARTKDFHFLAPDGSLECTGSYEVKSLGREAAFADVQIPGASMDCSTSRRGCSPASGRWRSSLRAAGS